MKDLVYKSEKLSCTDDMKGDISSFTVAGDKIYVYTTEWVPGPGNTEDAEAEEEAFEAKDQEETADGDAAVATTEDADRQSFIKEATDGVKACQKDGIPVIGYMYWSLLDNFEWQKGYSMTFGLIAVDRTTMERSPKKSLEVLGEIAKWQ